MRKAELLPTLNAFVTLNNNGLSGSPNTVLNQLGQSSLLGGATNSYFVGGQGVLLSQVFGRNFPDYAIGLNLNIPIRNRTAQADYILDQLTIRQSELALAKQEKQIRVDVQNAMIGVQQARSGYFAAVKARILQEQTLDAEQKKLALGASTIFNVILIQRDLATAQSAEVSALGTYAKSKVQLDASTGQTLDTYGVKIEEAFRGQVSRGPSPMPPELPPANQPSANQQPASQLPAATRQTNNASPLPPAEHPQDALRSCERPSESARMRRRAARVTAGSSFIEPPMESSAVKIQPDGQSFTAFGETIATGFGVNVGCKARSCPPLQLLCANPAAVLPNPQIFLRLRFRAASPSKPFFLTDQI